MFIKQKMILKKNTYDIIILVYFYLIFCYPDSDPRFLKWIWIWPNEVDPGGFGSATLIGNFKRKYLNQGFSRG